MTREYLIDAFRTKFPDLARQMTRTKKIGSRMISIDFAGPQESLTFLYNGPKDWSLGTKAWRKCPEPQKGHAKEDVT